MALSKDTAGHGTPHRAFVDPDDGRVRILAVMPVSEDGAFMSTGPAFEVLESDEATLDGGGGTTGSIAVPANAFGGVSLSSCGASPVVIWVSVGTDEGANIGYRITAGGYRWLPARDTTVYINAISSPASLYYTIYGIPE